MEVYEIILLVLGIAVGIIALGILLFLFLVSTRRSDGRMEKYKSVKFAHRGLHGEGRAENSMSAFMRARENGFGIELDVRLSADGELVVFHDNDLDRVCGKEGRVADYTAAELREMKLAGTNDGIPTFREVLEAIDGAVPLLIEIKSDKVKDGVSERVLEELKDYRGDYIVESFNPFMLRKIRRGRPDILIGILSCIYKKNEKTRGKPLYSLLENLYLNFLMRPDFIAYEKDGYAKRNLRFLRHTYRAPLFAWTIESAEEEAAAISHGFDSVIFEGYIPEK
ncbi:MAG: glycerophosphodiester phosphodiesterase [Clostridia bacterium]|nr:glycerophosphodiester phosphodiesterase [Clostridia bacterium]